MQKTILVLIAVMLMTGCARSNQFTPKPEMTGKQIFSVTCIECHKPHGKYVMVLDADMKDVDKIANQVLTGSMSMPSYPNIQGEPARRLAEYVLENSRFD